MTKADKKIEETQKRAELISRVQEENERRFRGKQEVGIIVEQHQLRFLIIFLEINISLQLELRKQAEIEQANRLFEEKKMQQLHKTQVSFLRIRLRNAAVSDRHAWSFLLADQYFALASFQAARS